MSKFDIKLLKQGDELKVEISGIIDEDVDFTKYPINGNKSIELDLKGIKSINSCGIREWIKWLNTVKQTTIEFQNCPKIIVDQINMVDGFLPVNAKVNSFYVPYYNDENGSEKSILFKYGSEFKENTIQPPEKVLDDSGAEMEMDVIQSKYFKFIKKA